MSAKWIDYKGKKILYQDYHGLKEPEMLETLEETKRLMVVTPGQVLTLINMTGAFLSAGYMSRVKEVENEVFAPKVEKSALIGIQGMKKIFYDGFSKLTGKNIPVFATEAEALEWLVK